MNNKEEGMENEGVVTRFEVLSRNLPGQSRATQNVDKNSSSPK